MISSNYWRLALLIAVGIAATATAADAAVGAATRNIRIAPQDTSLNPDARNYSTEAILAIRTSPHYQVANAIILKFDLSNLPAGAIVQTATVHLALVQSDDAIDDTYSVSAHKLIAKKIDVAKATGFTADGVTAWTPNACCLNDAPMAQADISPAYDAQTIDKAPGFKAWDVTRMVQEWLMDPATNSGLLLNGDLSRPGDHYRFFASMEHSSTSLRPYLRVEFQAPDPTPPVIAITRPASGARVSGTVPVTAEATDDGGIAALQFLLDGAQLGAVHCSPPYAFDWDTSTVSDGVHVLTAIAKDAAGNVATSAATSLTLENGVIVLSPADTSLKLDVTNYSAAPLLMTYTWPDSKVANAIMMKFDLAAIPPGAVVEQATVRLALVESDPSLDLTYTVSAHKILGKHPAVSTATGYTADGVTPWTASACCYNGVPLAQGDISSAYDQQAIDKVPGYKAWTITAMVQEWLADPSTNLGLLINPDTSKPGDRYRFFASMEHDAVLLRPYLQVKYSMTSPSDATPPSVTMTTPAPDTYVSGTVRLSASATDDVAVADLQFNLGGAPLGPDLTAPPYVFDWDTTAIADGEYTLTATARDAAGNVATSPGVRVTKDKRPPAISGVSVSSITASSASIEWTTDEPSDSQVEYGLTTDYGNSTSRETNLVSCHSTGLSGLADGTRYHFRIRSRDAAGNLATSPDATFDTPANADAIPPTASITTPADGATVSGTIVIEANASDNIGVAGIQFKVNGVNLGAEDTASPYSVSWNTATVADGSYALTAAARDAAGNQTTSSVVTVNVSNAAPAPSSILWFADHEEGNMSDWYTSGGGGEFNSGGGVSTASRDVAHTGAWSAKGTITTGVSAVRLFRWQESRANPQAYYSAWYYFPQKTTSSAWGINVFQFKSKLDSERSDPFWDLNVRLRSNGNMYLIMNWWCGLTVEGPHRGESGCRAYQQALKDLPVAQWVHIEAFLRQSTGFDGQIIIWQDGVEIFNQNNVKTRYPTNGGWGPNDWAINDYGENIFPTPYTIYFDDAAISLTRLGPGTSDTQPPTTSCQTIGASWRNSTFAPQSGTFTAQFDATPGGSNVDGVIGLAAGSATTFTDLASIVRFNNVGTIDARNGGSYSAVASIPYVAGTTYRVRMVVNVATHTYSVYVTPSGGIEQTVGLNYAFRSEQAATNTLAAVGSYVIAGTVRMCNFAVSP